MKAVLIYLARPYVVKEFSDFVSDVVAYDAAHERRFEDRILRQKFPPYPNLGRNALTIEAFRRWGGTFDTIVWMDDDMQPERVDDVYQLLDRVDAVERPIVGGLYFALHDGGKVRPLVYELSDPDAEGFKTMWRYPRNALIEQPQVGMGFCAIHASCFIEWADKHGPTWFDYDKTPKGRFLIEDAAFCRRMRKSGKSVWVHTGIKANHWKTVPVGEETFDAQNALERERSGGGF